MNWRRGLFRLWVVLSICWVVGVAVIATPEIRYEIRRADQAASALATFDEESYWQLQHTIESARQRSAREGRAETSNSLDATLFAARQGLRDPTPEEAADLYTASRVEELTEEARQAARHRNGDIVFWIGFAGIPVVVVFLIGSGLLWAVAGLRQ